MSLINQMLKDLEKRERQPAGPEITLSGLFSKETVQLEPRNRPAFFIGLLFLIPLLSLGIIYKNSLVKKSQLSLQAESTPTLNVNHQLPNVTPSLPMSDPTPSVMTGMTLQVQQDVTSLRFLLNQDTYYNINPDLQQNKLTIVLDHTNLVAELAAVNYLNSAIKGMEMSNDPDGNLVITLTLNQNTELQHLELVTSEGHAAELQVDIVAKKTDAVVEHKSETSVSSTPAIKKPIEQFNIDQQYKYALDFSALGQNNKATQLLSNLLIKYPEFNTARESLISILLESGNFVKANKIVDVGLDQEPNYVPFIQLKARILVAEGKVNSALDLLQRAAPSIENSPDYHAFMAALYQQQGKSDAAAKVYEQLLSLNPDKAVWWMGLAIALESQGDPSEAKEAYVRAQNTAGLNPELRAYVQKRIDSI